MSDKTALARPRLVIHNAVSLDGRITGLEPDLGTYYRLASTWQEDATLVGSGTILASPEGRERDRGGAGDWQPATGDKRPLMVVADSRGRVRCWQTLRRAGYWRDVVALISRRTPESFRNYLRAGRIESIVAGAGRVDLRVALAALRREYGVRNVRCDSGGELNGALLRAGLVDELSLLVHPALVGDDKSVPLLRAQGGQTLRLTHCEQLERGLVWLRYRVKSR
jgi:2,5-diamino-6-(ribosylamino)-4(3H)-pyrimidinone 5'-phosphate reductase